MDMDNTKNDFYSSEDTSSVNMDEQLKGPDKVLVKQKLKKAYGSATVGMLLQFFIAMGVSGIGSVIAQMILRPQVVAENPQLQGVELITKITEAVNQSMAPVVLNTFGYLIANVSAFFIMVLALKAFKPADVFGKPKTGKTVILGFLGVLGLQSVSLFLQTIMEQLTGMSGTSEQFNQNMSISDDFVRSLILVVYMVIIAPITEEMLCRGLVLNAIAPVSRTFALVASSLIFGIMHGNFGQIFNGFLLGLVMGYMALKTNSIITSIIAHMICNANAMIIGFEGYALESETANKVIMIHALLLMVIGLTCLVLFLKKNGKINEDEDIIAKNFRVDIPNEKGELTWKILLARPSFWIFTAIYIILAFVMLFAA